MIMTPYEELANTIVLEAVRDYRKALSRYSVHYENVTFRRDKESLERFFRSEWFGVLTNLDPEVLIRKLCEEVA